MSSSSRSIAAARQKRAGEQSQPVNNSRPVTSISSQGAFAQQYQQQMMSQSIPVGSKNVRIAQNKSQMQGSSTNQMSQSDTNTKISVSNAIGLITLRLGRLENVVNDAIEEGGFSDNNNENSNSSIPSNMKVVSDEVFENIINRLNLIESKVIQITNQNDTFSKEIKELQTSILNMNSNFSLFITETNDRFIDYENALSEIEKNFEVDVNVDYEEKENNAVNETDPTILNEDKAIENIESSQNDSESKENNTVLE
jgi:hypothetical protein|uniref:Uncharacterized protein n=1 Tax=viral metagenome TaxID=1070528 RepID=A0A6C0D9W6_9ZZZZ